MNLTHIESRSSKRSDEGEYEFMVECQTNSGDLPGALEEIKSHASYFNVIAREYKDNKGN